MLDSITQYGNCNSKIYNIFIHDNHAQKALHVCLRTHLYIIQILINNDKNHKIYIRCKYIYIYMYNSGDQYNITAFNKYDKIGKIFGNITTMKNSEEIRYVQPCEHGVT